MSARSDMRCAACGQPLMMGPSQGYVLNLAGQPEHVRCPRSSRPTTQPTIRDPTCPACSKAIASGSVVLYRHGDLFHLRCARGTARLTSLDAPDRAPEERARPIGTGGRLTRLLEGVRRRRRRPKPRKPIGPS